VVGHRLWRREVEVCEWVVGKIGGEEGERREREVTTTTSPSGVSV